MIEYHCKDNAFCNNTTMNIILSSLLIFIMSISFGVRSMYVDAGMYDPDRGSADRNSDDPTRYQAKGPIEVDNYSKGTDNRLSQLKHDNFGHILDHYKERRQDNSLRKIRGQEDGQSNLGSKEDIWTELLSRHATFAVVFEA